MLGHDNIRWSLTLCLLCTNGIISSVVKPDILVALDGIAGFDLTEGDMNKHHIWPQGIIYYYIDDYSFDKVLRDRIRSYLDQTSSSTGLQFMEIPQPPKDDNSRWVFFLNRKAQLDCGDVAYQNFTSEGVQKVVLGYDCVKSEDLAEIILSLVGVPPQHNSPDRDDYITVNFDNILPEKHYLFKKMEPEDWMFKKFEYDFASAGHYTTHKHTLNGAETISPKFDRLHQPRCNCNSSYVTDIMREGCYYHYHYRCSFRTLVYKKQGNRITYKEGNKDLSATDIKKIRTTYNFISLKGKNQVKVPECSKLFVTGANFSNYIPATKPDKQLTHPAPNDSGDILPDNTKNNMSHEVNSNESSKPKDSKDIVEEADNKNHTKNVDTKNLNDETEHEIDQKKDFLSGKKLSLLKGTHGKKKVDKLMNKSDYSTDNEGHNKYLSGKKKPSKIQKLNKEMSFLSEKKKSLIKYTGKDTGANNSKMLLLTSDSSTSDEGHNKFLNGNEEQSDSHNTPTLNKQKSFLSQKKKLLLKDSGKDKKKKLSHKLEYFTGDEGHNKYLNEKEEQSEYPDMLKLNKQKSFLSEKKKLLLKDNGKDKKKKLSHKLEYFTGDEGHNKYLNEKEEQSEYPDMLKLNKQKSFISEKKKLLLKDNGKDKKKKLSHKLEYFTGDEGHNKYLNGKEERIDYPDMLKLNKQKTYLSEKKKLFLMGSVKNNKKKLSDKLDYFTGDEGHNKYLNGKDGQSDSPDTLKTNKEKKNISLKNSGKNKRGKNKNKDTLLLQSDYSTGDEGHNKYLNEKQKVHFL